MIKRTPKLLPGQIYAPVKGKYNLPIFVNDAMVSSFSWQYLIDTYIANHGHKADPKEFRSHLVEFVRSVEEDIVETYLMCEAGIMKEIEDNN